MSFRILLISENSKIQFSTSNGSTIDILEYADDLIANFDQREKYDFDSYSVIIISNISEGYKLADLLRLRKSKPAQQEIIVLSDSQNKDFFRSGISAGLEYIDDVTGLYNSRFLSKTLTQEINRFSQANASFALLFIDLDHFKRINDKFGHTVGNKVLRALAAYLRSHIREDDILCRYGGDEFLAILLPADLATAQTVSDRINHSLKNETFLKEEGICLSLSISIGISLFPQDGRTQDQLIQTADQAMYRAKETSAMRLRPLTTKPLSTVPAASNEFPKGA